ncbi:hypothetical protein MKW94_012329 [Papaver nudicaule]|uniref:Uncharacterized protein n=1 Tax=Papaver nudicaule TaxID=74823 RepID=A0AA41V6D3_PAPNU|nr:hypothetical protein [Papaver nudicaule]
MANRFRGFAGMFSSAAKNSTRTEGFGARKFSSKTEKSTKIPKEDFYHEYMKDTYGENYESLTYAERKKISTKRINRQVDRDMIKVLSIGVAGGLVVSFLYGGVAFVWKAYQNALKKKTMSANTAHCHFYDLAFKKCFLRPGGLSPPVSGGVKQEK